MKNVFLVLGLFGTGTAALLGIAEADALAQASEPQITDCAVTYTRTACPGHEEESYSKCDGQQTCTKYVAAFSEAECRAAAVQACANQRLNVTKSKILTVTYQGLPLKNASGEDDMCLDYPNRVDEFDQCDASCAVTHTRTACSGQETESYSKCNGLQTCTKPVAATLEAECRSAAVEACANQRLNVTASKVITASFNGVTLKSSSGEDDMCLDYPNRADEFNQCASGCSITYTRTACPGKEAESYSKCGGLQTCTKPTTATSEDECRAAAIEACANSRLDVTRSKVITARFNGSLLKSTSGGDDMCLDYPNRSTEFDQCGTN